MSPAEVPVDYNPWLDNFVTHTLEILSERLIIPFKSCIAGPCGTCRVSWEGGGHAAPATDGLAQGAGWQNERNFGKVCRQTSSGNRRADHRRGTFFGYFPTECGEHANDDRLNDVVEFLWNWNNYDLMSETGYLTWCAWWWAFDFNGKMTKLNLFCRFFGQPLAISQQHTTTWEN